MNRNQNLTVESLEGKMLLAASAIGGATPYLAAPQIAHLPQGPSTGIGITAFASIQATPTVSQAHLPHNPSTGIGFTGF